ncbi:MAG: NTP transferase domain-containing protein [Spirochaetia bacterium]|jgi:molybdopterin-guanine dinucleotide biosynthesis protein A|nr:NTP transferase domain-containing protein [Spirochaetia bacterium]
MKADARYDRLVKQSKQELRGWYFHPFEFAVTGPPGRRKRAFITSLLAALKADTLDCGYMNKISDPLPENKYLLNDILLVETQMERTIPFFLFQDYSSGSLLRPVPAGSLNKENLLGIITKEALLPGFCDNQMFSNIQQFKADDFAEIISAIRAWIIKRSPPIAPLLLCGGGSKRMGEDKNRIIYREEPQILRMAKLLISAAGGPVTVSVAQRGKMPQELESLASSGQALLLPDSYDSFGPMGGILTAMNTKPEKAWLAAAVDLPLLEESDLIFLIKNRNPLKFATAFSTPLPEPLLTIYEPKSLPRMMDLFERSVSSPREFLKRNPYQELGFPRGGALFNANTPEEKKEAQARLHTGS